MPAAHSLLDIHTIGHDDTLLRSQNTKDQIDKRGLSCSGRSNERHRRILRDCNIHIGKHRLLHIRISKLHMFHTDFLLQGYRDLLCFSCFRLGTCLAVRLYITVLITDLVDHDTIVDNGRIVGRNFIDGRQQLECRHCEYTKHCDKVCIVRVSHHDLDNNHSHQTRDGKRLNDRLWQCT